MFNSLFKAFRNAFLKVMILLGGLFAVWLLLLFIYLYETQKDYPAPSAKNDSIVVLTGGSNRIDEGLKLKDELKIDALFISGVYKKIDLKNLDLDNMPCCIELGHKAINTKENAYETWGWLRKNNYSKIILVTSDYHMPRALDVFKKVIRDIEITPYPVHYLKLRDKEFMQDSKNLRLIVHEYHKFLFQRITGLMEIKYE